MKKNKTTAWTVLFLLLFIAPSILYAVLKPYISLENTENRNMAQRPTLTLESFESYPAEFEDYYNDAMPFRSQLIRLNNTLQYFLFRQQDINGVAIGQDGWLFYCSEEAGNPVNQSLGCWHFTQEQLEEIAESLQRTKDLLEAKGKEFVLFIPPNKETIYMEKLPTYYEQQDEYTATDQLIDYLHEHTTVKLVYPKDELLSYKSAHPDTQLYKKLDSHWNKAGAYIGAKALTAALGIEMPELSSLEMTEIRLNDGDLSMVMNAAVTDIDRDYELSGITPLITETLKEDAESEYIFKTVGADPRKVFIARDSYSLALAPMLATQFESTVFVHHTLFKPELIEEFDADIYVLEIVERNEYQIPLYCIG